MEGEDFVACTDLFFIHVYVLKFIFEGPLFCLINCRLFDFNRVLLLVAGSSKNEKRPADKGEIWKCNNF